MFKIRPILSTIGISIFVLATFASLGSMLQHFNLSDMLANIGIIVLGVAVWMLGAWIDPSRLKQIPATAVLCFLFGLPCLTFPGVDYEILDPRITFSFLTVFAMISLAFGVFLLMRVRGKKPKPAGVILAYAGLTYASIYLLIALLVLFAILQKGSL